MKNNKLEIGLGVVVLTITIIFLAMVFMSGGADFYIKILIVFAAVLLGAVVYIWKLLKKRKDIKSGVTVEDEFTEIVTLYAGKKAFMGSMYLWFFIYIYKNLFGDAYPFSYNFSDLARYYAAYEKLMAHWHTVMPGVIYDIYYEDLVADTEGQSRPLFEHCNLQWQEQCLNFYDNQSASTTASASQIREPVYNSSVGKWRHYATELNPLIELLHSEGVELVLD